MGGTSRTCLASVEDSYRDEFRRLRRVFASRGVGAEEAADLAQETVARAIVHLKRHGQQADDLRPLLNTISRNLLIERVRARSAQLVDIDAAEHVADPAPEPAERIEAAERAERVRAGLAELPARHRQVVKLWMEGYDADAIARELGIKRNAAYALLHRARRKLVAALGSQGPLGLVVVAWAGLRLRARRLANTVASLDPSGSLASSGTSVAVVSLAAVITLGSGGLSVAVAETPRGTPPTLPKNQVLVATSAPSTAGAAVDGVGDRIAHPDESAAALGSVEVDVADRRLAARANPHNRSDDGEDDIELDIWHRPGEGDDRGVTGPLIEEAVVSICAATDFCREDR